MAYDRTTIEGIRDRAAARLYEILENPKPSYIVDGQNVQWKLYQDMLRTTVDWANNELDKVDGGYFITDQILRGGP